jgi:hypothetical protein
VTPSHRARSRGIGPRCRPRRLADGWGMCPP